EWHEARNGDTNRRRLRCQQSVRRRVGDAAQVLDTLSGTRAALELQALARAHGEREVDAAPFLERAVESVVPGPLDLILRDSVQRRRDVVQSADGVAAAAREARVGRRRDVVRLPG